MENIVSILKNLPHWLSENVFTLSTTIQFSIIVICTILSWLIAHILARLFKNNVHAGDRIFIDALLSRFHLSFYECMLLFCTPIIIWIATIFVCILNWPAQILKIVATILTAWAIICVFTGIIRNYFISRVTAAIIWFFTVLYCIGWLSPFLNVLDNSTFTLGNHPISILSIFKGALIIAFLLWLAGIFTKNADNMLSQTQSINESQKNLILKLIKIFFIILAIIIGLNTVGIDLTALAVFGGALGISIGVGLQKIFSNLISGLVLIGDRSVKIGDLISVAETTGWVNKIGARCVSVSTRDGKQHLIPNELLITNKVENWSFDSPSLRLQIPIIVPWDVDRHLVKKLILECAKNHPHVLSTPQPNVLIKDFIDNRVEMELWAWINDPLNGLSIIRSELYESIWDTFNKYDIVNPAQQHTIQITQNAAQKLGIT